MTEAQFLKRFRTLAYNRIRDRGTPAAHRRSHLIERFAGIEHTRVHADAKPEPEMLTKISVNVYRTPWLTVG